MAGDTASRCPVVEAFERQVDIGADRPAVLLPGPPLRYPDQEERANAVANLLLDRLGPRSVGVALLVRDPVHMLAALLGVLKAGNRHQ